MQFTATIPLERKPVFEAEYARLVSTAVALGVAAPTCTFGEECSDTFLVGARKCKLPAIEVTVTGEAPNLAGWEVVAMVEHGESDVDGQSTPANLIFKLAELPEGMLTEFRGTDQFRCDHCRHRRNRTNTFVVRHEDGTLRQIGSSCIQNYTGGNISPELLVRFMRFYTVLEGFHGGWDDCDEMGGGQLTIFDLVEFVAWVLAILDRFGYRSRTKWGYESTADLAFDALRFKELPKILKEKGIRATETHRKEAQEVLSNVHSMLAMHGDRTEFEHNLWAVVNRSWVKSSSAGFAAYLPVFWRRHLDRLNDANKPQYAPTAFEAFGPVDSTYKDVIVTVADLRELRTGNWMYKFLADSGHMLVWFTRSPKQVKDKRGGPLRPLEIGDRVKVAFKVADWYDPRFKTTKISCVKIGAVKVQ